MRVGMASEPSRFSETYLTPIHMCTWKCSLNLWPLRPPQDHTSLLCSDRSSPHLCPPSPLPEHTTLGLM